MGKTGCAVSAAVFLCLSGIHATAQIPDVVINEINYAAKDQNNPAEFIELHNKGTGDLDLSGWRFDAGVDFTFPAATVLPAHGYLVVSADPARFATRWGFQALGPWTGKLSNKGEQVRLRDSAGTTVDTVTYGAGFPWPSAAAGDGASMELINPNLDNDLGGSWRSSGQASGSGDAQVYLPPADISWHYRKGTDEASSPTGDWRYLAFVEDGTWTEARTSIGYGDGDDNTVLDDMRNQYSSLYLRRVFSVSPGEVPESVTLKVRVDDGCIVWINGQEVARFHVDAGLVPAHDSLAQDHEADPVGFETVDLPNAASFLTEGANLVAVQAFNSTLNSSDFTIDVSLEELPVSGGELPTPGAINSCYAANAPPAIRQVDHFPEQPVAGQEVTVTAKATDPGGVTAMTLRYQEVNPGSYIRKTDAAFASQWTDLPMFDDGTHGDVLAGDAIYTAVVPGSVQTHRRLVRYRIVAADSAARTIEVPYADDASPNFAYFVYNGLPDWTGAFNPGTTPAVTYPASVLQSLPTYQLIAGSADVSNSQYSSSYNGQRFFGSLVYGGKVYDHIQFYNRGEVSTYTAGKNKWRVRFNTAHDFQAHDNWGRPYAETWDTLNLNACASPWVPMHRGMSGIEEALSFRLYGLLGMSSPSTHFLQFRVIDDAVESYTSSQFSGGNPTSGGAAGDLWGLYLAVEHPDGSFLDARNLPDGNVYKIETYGVGDLKHQGDGQPTGGSDWTSFLAASKATTPAGSSLGTTTQSETWWRENLDLSSYYNFHIGNRIDGNVDLRDGSNHFFHHNPDGHWTVIPWDLDMMFIAKTHQPSNSTDRANIAITGTIDQRRALTVPALKVEFQNRAREVLDLMCEDAATDGGQIGQLIDEYAQFVHPDGAAQTWSDIDAAMWNQNPRSSAAHKGNFFKTPFVDSRRGGTWTRTLATADFAGQVKYLTNYATNTYSGGTWAMNNGNQSGYGYKFLETDSADTSAPQRPTATYLGALEHPLDDIRFNASAFVGTNSFAASQWRIGEISAPGIPLYDPTKPRVYEVTDVWRSAEIASNGMVTIPPAVLKIGHTYRARVRHLDVTGRWSRWSNAIQFVTSSAETAISPNDLVVSEFMYNPAGLSAAETAAGFTDGQDFEYIQLLNISSATLNLEGLAFTSGIDYTFAPGMVLPPGERIVVAKNTTAFAFRHGTVGVVVGPFSGNLSNSGERLVLTSIGQAVQDFTYDDADPWPVDPDGSGPSLVLMNPETSPDHNQATNWRRSTNANGSPGHPDLITYTEWKRRYPGIGDANDDSDNDGCSNWEEYVYGSSPITASSHPAEVSGKFETLAVNSEENSYFVFTFSRSAESGDVDYFVESSPDLLNWSVTGALLQAVDNGDGTITEKWRCAQPVNSDERLFSRLRAQSK